MKTRLNKLKVRLRNYKVLLALTSGIISLLVSLGVINLTEANHFNVIIGGVLTVLISLGIVSDPEGHVKEPPDEL